MVGRQFFLYQVKSSWKANLPCKYVCIYVCTHACMIQKLRNSSLLKMKFLNISNHIITNLDSYLQAAMNFQHKVMKMNPAFPPIRRPEKGEIK